MARWHFDNVPDDLDGEMREIAKRDRVSLKAAVVQRLRTHGNPTAFPRNSHESHMADTRRAKFVPPTVEEAQKEISEKGYHFGAEEFVAFYAARGWKLKSGAMKDWKAAMVTWESRWRQEHGVVEEQPRVGQVVKAVKCATCGDEGMVMQRPEVAGPRLIPCPACSGGGLWTGMGSGN